MANTAAFSAPTLFIHTDSPPVHTGPEDVWNLSPTVCLPATPRTADVMQAHKPLSFMSLPSDPLMQLTCSTKDLIAHTTTGADFNICLRLPSPEASTGLFVSAPPSYDPRREPVPPPNSVAIPDAPTAVTSPADKHTAVPPVQNRKRKAVPSSPPQLVPSSTEAGVIQATVAAGASASVGAVEPRSSLKGEYGEYGHVNMPVTMPTPAEQALLDAPFVKKRCKNCQTQICVKDITLKCRRCNHCTQCLKNLKTGGGRHRLCPLCSERCFDHRDGRVACQVCKPTRAAGCEAKMEKRRLKQLSKKAASNGGSSAGSSATTSQNSTPIEDGRFAFMPFACEY